LDCEEELLAIAAALDIRMFLEAGPSELLDHYDISLVEGSITTAHDAERILDVRARSGLLITIGACATAGGVQALSTAAGALTSLGQLTGLIASALMLAQIVLIARGAPPPPGVDPAMIVVAPSRRGLALDGSRRPRPRRPGAATDPAGPRDGGDAPIQRLAELCHDKGTGGISRLEGGEGIAL
jgi:Ni,Fe-hydrogenase III small subunit